MNLRSFFLALIFSLTASLVSAVAEDRYCAVAYSPSTGAYGYSHNYTTEAAARRAAANFCIGNGGRSDVVTYWAKNGWAALATGQGTGYGFGWGTSKAIAQSHALRECAKRTSGARIRAVVRSH